MATTAIAAAEFSELARFRFLCEDAADVALYGGKLGISIEILTTDQYEVVRAGHEGRHAAVLDDGRVLTARIVELDQATRDASAALEWLQEPLDACADQEAQRPEWVADARELRGLLIEFLGRLPKTERLVVRYGGNGSAAAEIAYGSAGLLIAMGKDESW